VTMRDGVSVTVGIDVVVVKPSVVVAVDTDDVVVTSGSAVMLAV